MIPETLAASLHESAAYFVHLSLVLVPLFLAGSFLVGLVDAYLPPATVERTLRGTDEGVGNVLASGFGAITPFCSCSTVPVLAGLLQAGAPLGLAFSFLLASPLVNEIAVILLLATFGLEITVAYVLATFTAAVVGGILIGRLGFSNAVKDVELIASDRPGVVADGGGTGCGCNVGPTTPTHRTRIVGAARDAWGFLRDTGPYLVLGITIGALIHGLVPTDVIHALLGPENPLAIPLAVLTGAPIYVSMSGMLPIAATLSDRGIAIGTVLAFVIGGAGISIPNLVLLNRLFDRRLLAVYATTIVGIGIAIGVLFNLLFA